VELTTERINNNEAKSIAATQQERERESRWLANFAAANKPLVHEPESEDHSQ